MTDLGPDDEVAEETFESRTARLLAHGEAILRESRQILDDLAEPRGPTVDSPG